MKINITDIADKLSVVLRKYPVESIISIIFFITAELLGASIISSNRYSASLWYFPIVFCIAFACNNLFSTGRLKPIYYISILALTTVFAVNMQPYVHTVGYYFGLLLSGFLLFQCKNTKDNNQFAKNFANTLIHLLISALISLVFFLAIISVFGTINYIFGVINTYYEYTWQIPTFVIAPLSFLYFQNSQPSDENAYISNVIKILVVYIICPCTIVYTAILYVYSAKILALWELPKGGVAWLIIGFYLIAITGRMMLSLFPTKYLNWYSQRFSVISIPLLVLFWVGIVYRIGEYSFTESRVYIVAAGVMMTLCSIMLLSKKFGNYRLISVIASVMIVSLTYIPGISAKSIGIGCQERRLQNLIDSGSQDMKEIISCYKYISGEKSEEYAAQKFGNIDTDIVLEDRIIERKEPVNLGVYNIYMYSSTDTQLNIVSDKDNGISILHDEQQIINIPVSQVPEVYNSFVYSNDSLMIVFDKIWLNNNTMDPYYSTFAVFKKYK